MSGLNRLRQIFAATPSIKPKTTTVRPSPPPPPPHVHKYDYSTPESIRKAVDDFKKSCEINQFRRRVYIYSSIIHNLTKAQAFPMIEEIIEYQKQYKEISHEGFVVRLIYLYGKAGMLDHARKLFDEMPSFNSPRTVKSFTALLKAHISAKKYDAVEHLFRQISSEYGIQPNVNSYNVVIHAHIQMGDLYSAFSVFREMEEMGLKPDLITFNTLLGGFQEGDRIWALIQARDDISPDLLSYRFRLKGMFLEGRVEEAVKLVDEMRVNGVEPDARVFNVFINGFCKDGKLEEAKYWYGELVKTCIADRETYMTLVPFLVEKGDFDMAFKLCKEAMSGKKLLIDVEVMKQQLKEFLVDDQMDGKLEELFRLLEVEVEVEPA